MIPFVSTRVAIIYRIVIAIAIEVQAVDGFGVEVGGIIGRNESAPLGAVISSVAVVQTGIFRTIIAIGTKTGTLATANSAFLFYHLPGLQSRKSLPGRNDLGNRINTGIIGLYFL